MGCLRRRFCLRGSLPFVRKFTSKEIETATNGFSTILESGPRGTAYKAQFTDGLVATVRRAISREQEKDAFYLELQMIGRLNHHNIVRLHGFSEGHYRFLVFDHMENRSLKQCLHDPLRTPLNWRTRLQVAIDVAAALDYLYNFCDPPVFHVSVDSSNVMMDSNYVAKLSGVSIISYKLKDTAESNAASFEGFTYPTKLTHNQATFFHHAKVVKSFLIAFLACDAEHVQQRRRDLVFQYGVLILELVTGQSPGGEGELVRWVQEPRFACSMDRMVDADLGNTYDSKELQNLLIIARLCTRPGDDDALIAIPRILRFLQAKVEHLR